MELSNSGCLRCKRKFKITEVDRDGFPLHFHYCNECTKQCTKCGLWYMITQFLPIKEHPSYEDWIKSRQSEHDSPLGLLMGRDVVIDRCITCQPYYTEVEPPRVHQSPIRVPEPSPDAVKYDAIEHLERLLNGLGK